MKCQRNIYSDDEEISDEDLELQNGFAPTQLKNRDRLFGVYKQSKIMFLEKHIKDDFNTFYPVKFENEKQEDDPQHFEDDYERIEQKKK